MDYYNERCYGSQKTSVKRCRNYVVNSNHLCNIHFNEVKKNKKLILYNGSIAEYDSEARKFYYPASDISISWIP